MAAHYAGHCYVEDWPQLVQATGRLEERLRLARRPDAAAMLTRAFATLHDDLVKLEVTQALLGTVVLRETERKTRVRPDTGGRGGPELGRFLRVQPIDTGGLLPGSLGIANLDLLEANVRWWITNEVGSHGRVGGLIYGTFYGSASAGPPNEDEFRQHPLFQKGPNAGGNLAGRGIIERPIPARFFVAKAAKLIDESWRREFGLINAAFNARYEAVKQMRR